MKVSGADAKRDFMPGYNSSSEIIRKIYPDIGISFFLEKPNIYDQRYIKGPLRELAEFKIDGYFNKKSTTDSHVRKIYSEYLADSACISPDEANTQEGSWATVVSGKRRWGNFLLIACILRNSMQSSNFPI